MPKYTEITEPVTVELVGQGPQTVSSGFLVPTERPGTFELTNDRPADDDDDRERTPGDNDSDPGDDGRADTDGSRLTNAKQSTTSDAPASGENSGQTTGGAKRNA